MEEQLNSIYLIQITEGFTVIYIHCRFLLGCHGNLYVCMANGCIMQCILSV